MQSQPLHLSPLFHALAQYDTNPASTGIAFHCWNVSVEPIPAPWKGRQLPQQVVEVVAYLLLTKTLP